MRTYVHGFDIILERRNPNRGQLARWSCGNKLGRELTDDDMAEATSLHLLTRAQRDVARELAVKAPGYAQLYLYQLVPLASDADRDAFLDSLAEAE